jgi:hypothetical protein
MWSKCEQTTLRTILSRSKQPHDGIHGTHVSLTSARSRGDVEIASSVGLHKKDLRCRARVEVFRVTCGSERVRDNTRTCRATCTRATVFLLEKKVPVSLRHSQSFSDSFYYEGTCTRTVLYCSCTRTVRVRVHLYLRRYNVVRKYWKYLRKYFRKYLRRYVLSYESTFVLSYLRTHYTVQLQYRLHTTHVHSTRTVHVMYEDT